MSSKKVIYILDSCKNETRYIWKHIWMTQRDRIESDLQKKGIYIFEDSQSTDPVAIPYTPIDTACILIARVFNEKTAGIKAKCHVIGSAVASQEADKLSKQMSTDDVGIYKGNLNEWWIVGSARRLDDVIRSFDFAIASVGKGKGTINQTDKTFDETYEELPEPVYIRLREEEKAIMLIYNLLKIECLQQSTVAISYSRQFDFKISVPDMSTKDTIENQLRSKIDLYKDKIESKVLSFSPRVYKFILEDSVHEFVKSKMVFFGKPDFVWFKGTQNTLTVYAVNRDTVERKCKLMKDYITEDSVAVPPRYFKTEEAVQKLSELENKQRGKLSLELSKSCTTVNIVCTSDISSPKASVQCLFYERTLSVSRQNDINCKVFFRKCKAVLEEKLAVDISEASDNFSYRWTISGEAAKVKVAFEELNKLQYSFSSETKTYISDENLDTIRSKVKNISDKSSCIANILSDMEVSKTKFCSKNVTDLRLTAPCRSLQMADGHHITVYKCSLKQNPWLMKDCLVVNVLSVSEKTSSAEFNIRRDNENNCYQTFLYLPDWKENVNKEKDALDKVLNGVMAVSKSHGNGQFMSLAFDLVEVNKLRWPGNKYLKGILYSIQTNQPAIDVHIHEYSEDKYEKASKRICDWCTAETGQNIHTIPEYLIGDSVLLGRVGVTLPVHQFCLGYEKIKPNLKITVVKGELAKQKSDILVNSTNGTLILKQGFVSGSLLRAAGGEIQKECSWYLSSKGKVAISYTEVVITSGYGLSCKKVFHGTLPHCGCDTNQNFEKFIQNCLIQAVALNVESITFPALGTGKLGYPPEVSAKIMFDVVDQFTSSSKTGALRDVRFVIYPDDEKVVKAFEYEETKRNEKGLAWNEGKVANPDFLPFDVSVVGENINSIQQTFKQIYDILKKKDNTKDEAQAYGGVTSEQESFVKEPEEQKMIREETNKSMDNSGKQKREMVDQSSNDMQGPDNTFAPPDTYDRQMISPPSPKPEDCSGSCHVDVEIIKQDGNMAPFEMLTSTLNKYGDKESQVVWCPRTPMKARLKFQVPTDASHIIDKMKDDKRFKLQKSSLDAVVNIKATLNGTIDTYLQTEYSRLRLITQSGVGIEDKTGRIILTGDLTAISTARDILMNWKSQGDKVSLDDENITNQLRLAHSSSGSFDSKTHSHNTVVSDTSNPNVRVVEEEKGKLQMRIFNDKKASVTDRHDDTPPITEINNDKTPYMAKDNELYPDLENQTFETGNSNKGVLYPALNTSENAPETRSIGRSQGAIPKTSPRSPVKKDNFAFDNSDSRSENNMRSTTHNSSDPVRVRHTTMRQNSKFDQEAKVSFIYPQDDDLMMITKAGIKVFVYKADICNLNVECIVNSSDSQMTHGGGLSKEIAKQSGSSMIDACKRYIAKHGVLSSEDVCSTTAGNMSHYKTILHINAPKATSGLRDEDFADALSAAVYNCLHKASKEGLKSIALPAISSGYGKAPKDVQFKAYPKGVISFSGKTKKLVLREIHFVDRDQDVVDHIRAAFLHLICKSDSKWKEKWQKIPQKVKEIFIPHIPPDDQVGKSLELQLPDGRMVLVVCDSSLMTSLKHQHIKRLMQQMGSDLQYIETAVVITEDKDFSGKSNSSKKCLERGGHKYKKDYNGLKKNQKKRKAGEVLPDLFGDEKIDFNHVLCSIMPSFSYNARYKNSSAQTKFFQKVDECYRNTLREADKLDVKHLSMPVLCADFYDCTEEWFLRTSISNMIAEIKEFGKSRVRPKNFLIVHVVTNSNEAVFEILRSELSKDALMESAL